MNEFNPNRFKPVSTDAASRSLEEQQDIIDEFKVKSDLEEEISQETGYEEYLAGQTDFETAMAARDERNKVYISDDPKLRRMLAMAQEISQLRGTIGVDPSAEFIIADKEFKLSELASAYADDSQKDKDTAYLTSEGGDDEQKQAAQDKADKVLDAKLAALNFIIDQTDTTSEAVNSTDADTIAPNTPDNAVNPEKQSEETASVEDVQGNVPEDDIDVEANPATKNIDSTEAETVDADKVASADETSKDVTEVTTEADDEHEPGTSYEVLGTRMIGGREYTRLKITEKTPDGKFKRAVMELDDEQLAKYFASKGIELPGEEPTEPTAVEQDGDEPKAEDAPSDPEGDESDAADQDQETDEAGNQAPVITPEVVPEAHRYFTTNDLDTSVNEAIAYIRSGSTDPTSAYLSVTNALISYGIHPDRASNGWTNARIAVAQGRIQDAYVQLAYGTHPQADAQQQFPAYPPAAEQPRAPQSSRSGSTAPASGSIDTSWADPSRVSSEEAAALAEAKATTTTQKKPSSQDRRDRAELDRNAVIDQTPLAKMRNAWQDIMSSITGKDRAENVPVSPQARNRRIGGTARRAFAWLGLVEDPNTQPQTRGGRHAG